MAITSAIPTSPHEATGGGPGDLHLGNTFMAENIRKTMREEVGIPELTGTLTAFWSLAWLEVRATWRTALSWLDSGELEQGTSSERTRFWL